MCARTADTKTGEVRPTDASGTIRSVRPDRAGRAARRRDAALITLTDPEMPAQLPAETVQGNTVLPLPEIVRRYAAGESVQALAAEVGGHRATLYRWMLAGTGDKEYADLVTHCLVQRVADADAALAAAREACDIARAREQARFARMDLERRRPQLYGPRQIHDANAGVTVQLVRFAAPENTSALRERDQTGTTSAPAKEIGA